MKIVVLDGYTENPGDLSWGALEALGEVTVYDRTSYVDAPIIAERLGDAEVAVINKTPISKATIDSCPNLKMVAVLATGYNVVDYNYCKEKGIELTFVLPPIDSALRELLVEPLGIDEPLGEVKKRLEATGAPVLDFEYEPIKTFAQEQYYDGLHLDVVHGLPEYTSFLFQEVMA